METTRKARCALCGALARVGSRLASHAWRAAAVRTYASQARACAQAQAEGGKAHGAAENGARLGANAPRLPRVCERGSGTSRDE
eukprot:3273102-Pleurochrysis_carterae.AAC.1